MQTIRTRANNTVRFLKWIREYSGWWYLICTPNEEHMNPQMMKLLIERLYQESFYEIIFVLLMVHRNDKCMEGFLGAMLLDALTDHWEDDKEAIIRRFIDHFE